MARYHFSEIEDITPRQAIQIQKDLKDRIEIAPAGSGITTVGGADLSFNRGSETVHAGITVLSFPQLEPVAHSLVTERAVFPYIPGLLAFREIPALMNAWEQSRIKPDVLILDGHGIAHPRRMGIATHFGILADHPTVGCAKNVLTGEYEEPGEEKGAHSWLLDGGEKIGTVLRSRTGVKPVFVSPGHKTDIESARKIVEMAVTRYKLPETTRTAHRLVNELRKGEVQEGYREY